MQATRRGFRWREHWAARFSGAAASVLKGSNKSVPQASQASTAVACWSTPFTGTGVKTGEVFSGVLAVPTLKCFMLRWLPCYVGQLGAMLFGRQRLHVMFSHPKKYTSFGPSEVRTLLDVAFDDHDTPPFFADRAGWLDAYE